MRAVLALLRPRPAARASVLLMVGFVAANCSSDSTRFDGNPFARNSAPVETTGSVPRGPQVYRRPLPPPPGPGRPGTLAGGGMSGGGRGMGSFRPSLDAGRPATIAPDVTGSTPRLRTDPTPRPRTDSRPRGRWTWEGGKPITVAPGETLASLSRRHKVPASAIAEANGLSGPVALRTGQRMVIPRYVQPDRRRSTVARPVTTAPAAVSRRRAPISGSHIVAPGETLTGIARRYRIPITALAAANRIPPHTRVKIGDRLLIPGGRPRGRTAAVKPEAKPAVSPRSAPAPRAAEKPAAAGRKYASIEPAGQIRVAREAPKDEVAEEKPALRGTKPAFRWPVRGRVIAGFGAKTNGERNDGINLAVPEGTAVRAAEDGIVAYAGNELKGYGNLILVRHTDGFVTAYAHASKIMVKRNDKVRRGQVIAKSGQTGNVTTPQLHFEIRKGSSPIDPMKHLGTGA